MVTPLRKTASYEPRIAILGIWGDRGISLHHSGSRRLSSGIPRFLLDFFPKKETLKGVGRWSTHCRDMILLLDVIMPELNSGSPHSALVRCRSATFILRSFTRSSKNRNTATGSEPPNLYYSVDRRITSSRSGVTFRPIWFQEYFRLCTALFQEQVTCVITSSFVMLLEDPQIWVTMRYNMFSLKPDPSNIYLHVISRFISFKSILWVKDVTIYLQVLTIDPFRTPGDQQAYTDVILVLSLTRSCSDL